MDRVEIERRSTDETVVVSSWTGRTVGRGRAGDLAMTGPRPTHSISSGLGQWLALRRVRRGHVVLVGADLVIDHERRVPKYLHAALHELLDSGHLYLGEERAEWRQRPVLMTPSGEQLHAKLEELRR